MNLEERIAQVKTLIAQRDEIDRQLAECLGESAAAAPAKEMPQRKSGKTAKRRRTLRSEIDTHHGDGRVSDDDKRQVEAALIDGLSIAACYERFADRLGVSAAWFYTVRARLRNEGRLSV